MSKIVVFDHDGTLVDTTGIKKSLFPGIKSLVETLLKEGHLLYVWTARSRVSTVEILKSLGIIGAFGGLYCREDNFPKPDGAGLGELLPDADPKDVVVISDSYADMIGACDYGAYALGAIWDKYANKDALTKYGAQKLAQTPEECYQFIKEYFKN